jgi:hypothetical protein
MKLGVNYMFSITLLEQLIISVILFVFNAFSVAHLDNANLALFTNTIGLIAFLQGLSKSFFAEKAIIEGGTLSLKKLFYSLLFFSLMSVIIIFFFLLNYLELDVFFLLILISVPVIVHFHAFRALFYAFSKKSFIHLYFFSFLLLICGILYGHYYYNSVGFLLSWFSLVFMVMSASLMYRVHSFSSELTDSMNYSNDISGYNTQIILNSFLVYIYSGLIYIVAAYLNASIVGEFRRTLFLLYPLNQVIAVLGLLYFPKLASGNISGYRFIQIGFVFFFLVAPAAIFVLYKLSQAFLDYGHTETIEFICLYGYSIVLFFTFALAAIIKVKNRLARMNKVVALNLLWFLPLFIAAVELNSILFIFGSVIFFQVMLCINFFKLAK